ncbi:MAG: hypothetical protein PUG60_16335 [Lachnospiraceae bacterium]|nr:hypothetical protein [Lachnospiraceae bacterium]
MSKWLNTSGEMTVNVTASAKYSTNDPLIDTKTIEVTQDLNIESPTNKRESGYKGEFAITGVTINNKPSTIKVGEEVVLIGTVIPAYWLQDNLVSFRSSNPDVASVSWGVLKGNSDGTAVITATAIGTTYTDSFTVTVQSVADGGYKASEIYYAPEPIADDSTTVTNWLVDQINYVSENGYKKLVLPNKTLTVSPVPILGNVSEATAEEHLCIFIPSDLCIDLNGCTIQMEASGWSTYSGQSVGIYNGYSFFVFDKNCKNSGFINGTLSGEVDQLSSITSGNEQVCMVAFRNCEGCYLEDVEVCNSPGFNITSTIYAPGGIGNATYIKDYNLEEGGYADNGDKREETLAYRTIEPMQWTSPDLLTEYPYYMIGSVWGTVGEFIDTTLYDIIWYKSNGDVLGIDRNNMLYYPYKAPTDAEKYNIVLHQDYLPTTGFSSYCFAPVFLHGQPRGCWIKNCNIHNNTSTGIAMVGGINWLVEGCTFKDNGFRDPSSHIDMEDHGDCMFGHIYRNNTFSGTGYFYPLYGRQFAIHNNDINSYCRSIRVYGMRVYNNIFHRSDVGFSYGGDCVFAQNITEGISSSARNKNTDAYPGYYAMYIYDNLKSDGTVIEDKIDQ